MVAMQLPEPVWCPFANPMGLTELEVASGMVVGQGSGRPLIPDHSADPVGVLRNQAREWLADTPCVVAFSGGRDSSALLAVLIDVARRDGLVEPIALTARWDDDAASDESAWQERVIAALGVRNWEIVRPGTDLDLLGTEATTALEQLGLMWPAPAYAFRPMMRQASGGVFLSGEGGDEAFGLWPYGRLWSTVRHRSLPKESDLRTLALGCLPRPLRRKRWMRNLPPYQRWLRDDALAEIAERLADDQADDPLRWDSYQSVSRRRRSMDLTLQTLQSLCALEGASYVAPFLNEGFLASLAAWGGKLGRGNRTEVMTELFSSVLPSRVLERISKASFGGVFWGPESRRFARDWSGSGVSTDLIDATALSNAWLAPVPVYGSALPLQAAWLFEQRRALNGPEWPLGGSPPPK